MATIGNDVKEQITSELDLFESIMQHNVIENELNREYARLATIQPGMAIEFTVKGATDLYLDLNNSRLHVLAKITKADGTNIDANTAAPINLTLHSMFREIGSKLNGRNVGDTSQLYLYRSHLETLLNFSKETQQTLFFAKDGQRTPPGTWLSPKSVGRMPVWTLAPRQSREVPWSSSSVDLTWTCWTKNALFLKT